MTPISQLAFHHSRQPRRSPPSSLQAIPGGAIVVVEQGFEDQSLPFKSVAHDDVLRMNEQSTENESQSTESAFDFAGYLAAFVACFVLAAQNSVSKICLARGLTPEDLVAIRFCLPGLFLLPMFIRRARRADGREFLRRGFLLAVVAGVPYGLILTNGYRFASASHGAVLVPSATLVGGMVMSRAVLGASIGRAALLSAGVALLGMSLVSSGATGSADTPNPLFGDFLFILCGFFWCCNPVLVQKFKAKPSDVVPSVMVWGLLYLPVYLSQSSLIPDIQNGRGPSWDVIAGTILFYAIIHSSFALPLYAWATRRISALRMALLTPFIPISGVLLAVALLGERLNQWEIAGGLLVCVALYLSVRMKSRAE